MVFKGILLAEPRWWWWGWEVALGQPWKAKAQWCFAQFRQEAGVTTRASSWLHGQPLPGNTTAVRGCSSCSGALPK